MIWDGDLGGLLGLERLIGDYGDDDFGGWLGLGGWISGLINNDIVGLIR